MAHYAWPAPTGGVIHFLSGIVTEEALVSGIAEAYRKGRAWPGADRLVAIAPATSLAHLDLAALRRVQETVLERETAGGRMPAFRGAIWDPEPLHRGLVTLYAALWEGPGFERVEYRVLATLSEGLAFLGLSESPFADMP